MAFGGKIFNALIVVLKMNDAMTRLSEEIKVLSKETRDIDKRLIRVETFFEIAEKQNKLSAIKELEV